MFPWRNDLYVAVPLPSRLLFSMNFSMKFMRYEPTLQPILRTSAFQVAFRIRCNLEKALYLSAGVLRTASAVGNVPWNRTLSYLASMLTVVKLHSITGAASAVDAFRRNIRFVQPGPFFRGFSSEVIVVDKGSCPGWTCSTIESAICDHLHSIPLQCYNETAGRNYNRFFLQSTGSLWIRKVFSTLPSWFRRVHRTLQEPL